MALGKYQQTALTHAGSLLQGGFRMGVAASAATFLGGGTVGTVLGIGNLTSFTENIEKTTTQAGNSNQPVQEIANHTCTAVFECLELWPPSFAMIRGGSADINGAASACVYIAAGTANSISTGGLTTLNEKAFCFENVTRVSGATAMTMLIIYKGRIEQGIAFTPKTDHDTDPVAVWPFTITGELDTTRTAGDQLFVIETELGV